MTRWDLLFEKNPHLHQNTTYYLLCCLSCFSGDWISSNKHMKIPPHECEGDNVPGVPYFSWGPGESNLVSIPVQQIFE